MIIKLRQYSTQRHSGITFEHLRKQVTKVNERPHNKQQRETICRINSTSTLNEPHAIGCNHVTIRYDRRV